MLSNICIFIFSDRFALAGRDDAFIPKSVEWFPAVLYRRIFSASSCFISHFQMLQVSRCWIEVSEYLPGHNFFLLQILLNFGVCLFGMSDILENSALSKLHFYSVLVQSSINITHVISFTSVAVSYEHASTL